MKQEVRKTVYLVVAAVMIASCHNSTSTSTTSNSDSVVSTTDTSVKKVDTTAKIPVNTNDSFVISAARGNAREIEMLEAGAEQGSNKKLKSDAKKMLDDHRKLNDALVAYATQKNITLSGDTDVDMSAMNSDNEATFDTAWTQKMIEGHQQTITQFEAAQNTVTDPDLKTMITNTLPTLHKHLDMCQELLTTLKK